MPFEVFKMSEAFVCFSSFFQVDELLQFRLQHLLVLLFLYLHLDPIHSLLQLLLDADELQESVQQLLANLSDLWREVWSLTFLSSMESLARKKTSSARKRPDMTPVVTLITWAALATPPATSRTWMVPIRLSVLITNALPARPPSFMTCLTFWLRCFLAILSVYLSKSHSASISIPCCRTDEPLALRILRKNCKLDGLTGALELLKSSFRFLPAESPDIPWCPLFPPGSPGSSSPPSCGRSVLEWTMLVMLAEAEVKPSKLDLFGVLGVKEKQCNSRMGVLQ